jgi:putative zinc finger/helix-turn-helix YgiT family protein
MSHSCAVNRVEHIASREQPFHFEGSGLSGVYLVGIKYYTCECGRVLADIPAIKPLMQLIARDLLHKQGSLTGEEIRFLRKRLGKKQTDFARAIGVEPETLNRYENGKLVVSEPSDKLIRLIYLLLSSDERLEESRGAIEELLTDWHVSSQPKKIMKKVTNNEWEDEPVAA